MGNDPTGLSQGEFATIASAMTGTASGAALASEALAEELGKRFTRLSTNAEMERDFEAGYDTAGKALILALRACSHSLNAAFDTESGAIIESKKPMSILSPPFTVTIAIGDQGTTTHVRAQVQHTGMDWGQNKKVLNELFDKTQSYLSLFKS
jgi:hypothetical protein